MQAVSFACKDIVPKFPFNQSTFLSKQSEKPYISYISVARRCFPAGVGNNLNFVGACCPDNTYLVRPVLAAKCLQKRKLLPDVVLVGVISSIAVQGVIAIWVVIIQRNLSSQRSGAMVTV